ncbi:MAG: hypothetical protein PHD56_12965 [Anaerostipes sp.]|nr:hypothetical protein [Anaerostipes sp.]
MKIKKNKWLYGLILLMVISIVPFKAVKAADTERDIQVANDSEVWNEDLSEDNNEYVIPTENKQRSDGYYYWKVTSKSVVSHPYGSYRNGPSGKGKATLTLSNSSTFSRTVTNTISGSYTSTGTIASSLGVSIGIAKTHSTSYSVSVPARKKYQIIYRPRYKKYKVVQTQYHRMDGYSSKTGSTKTCYVKVFENWDYTWKRI